MWVQDKDVDPTPRTLEKLVDVVLDDDDDLIDSTKLMKKLYSLEKEAAQRGLAKPMFKVQRRIDDRDSIELVCVAFRKETPDEIQSRQRRYYFERSENYARLPRLNKFYESEEGKAEIETYRQLNLL